VRQVLEHCIQHLCEPTESLSQHTRQNHLIDIVNVPDYFFVSSKIAKRYPALLESSMVLSFRSHIPNESLRNKWWSEKNVQQQTKRAYVFITGVGQVIAFIMSLAMVEIFGTIPMEVQKMFVRFIQPMLLSGAVILCLQIKKEYGLTRLLMLTIGPTLLAIFTIWLWTQYKARFAVKREQKVETDKFMEFVTNQELLDSQGPFHEIDSEEWDELLYVDSSISDSDTNPSSCSYAFTDSSEAHMQSEDIMLTISTVSDADDEDMLDVNDDSDDSSSHLSTNHSSLSSQNSYILASSIDESDQL
jgi:hypothetical protein